MNVTLSEWNDLLTKAKALCECMNAYGLNIKAKPYTLYNGHKGISFLVCDQNGDVFQSYYSGAGTAMEIESSMYRNALRIKKECGCAAGEG